MNRLASPPRQPHAPSPLDDVLAAPLQSALNSLNVQLERELARYRYARQGQTLPAKPVFKPRQRPLNLISVAAKAADAPALQGRPVPPPPPPNPRLQRSPAPTASRAGSPQTIPPLGWSGGEIVPQPAPANDYMASSEALLDSLADYGAEPMPAYEPPAPSWTQALATPLGMGALLLLLVVSGGLGYVLVNPAAVSHLANLWPFGSAPDAAAGPEGEGGGAPAAADRAPADLSPDLSEQEFVQLDLSALSTLPLSAIRPPQLASTPTTAVDSTPTTTAIAPEADTDPASTATPTAPTASTTPSASRPAPTAPRQTSAPAAPAAPRQPAAPPRSAPAPAAAAPAPATTPAPVAASTYYVVTNYTGDPSLNQARQVVGDAYVRNFPIGARIQLGAFSSEADAAAHADNLAAQGISAEVYNP